MVIELSPEVEAALTRRARQRGVSAESLANDALRERFAPSPPFEPQDEWERQLLSIPVDCGVSLPDEALSRENLYD